MESATLESLKPSEPPNVLLTPCIEDENSFLILTGYLRFRAAMLNGWRSGVEYHETELRKLGQSARCTDIVRSWPCGKSLGAPAATALALCDAISLEMEENVCLRQIEACLSHFAPEKIITIVNAVLSVNEWIHAGPLYGFHSSEDPSLL